MPVLRGGRRAFLCAAALLLLPASAHARAADPLGFGIEAVGQPSYFVFETDAGRTVRGAIRVVSTSDRVRTVHLHAAGATTAVMGGLEFDARGTSPRMPGRWLRLERSKARLPAHGAVEVPFVARVPRGVRTGDKLAGIVVTGRRPRARATGRRRLRLRFVSRLAVAVQFRVPGHLTRVLAVRTAGIQVAPAGATLGLQLESTGNALITRTTGTLRVLQRGRELFREHVDVGAFVPGTATTYPVRWRGTPVEGEYQVRGTLRPEGGAPVRIDRTVRFDAGRIERYRLQTGRHAVGVAHMSTVVALVAIVAAALAGLAAGRTRLRRRGSTA